MERIKQLTNINVEYLGNLKLTKKKNILFNYDFSENIKIMVANTHDEEENLIVPSLEVVSKKYHLSNFFIAPRHPNRSKLVYELLKTSGGIE